MTKCASAISAVISTRVSAVVSLKMRSRNIARGFPRNPVPKRDKHSDPVCPASVQLRIATPCRRYLCWLRLLLIEFNDGY